MNPIILKSPKVYFIKNSSNFFIFQSTFFLVKIALSPNNKNNTDKS